MANRLDAALDAYAQPPKVFILRLRLVPMIDASGVTAIRQLVERCTRKGTQVILSGLQPQPREVLAQMGVTPDEGRLHFVADYDAAVALAARLTQGGS